MLTYTDLDADKIDERVYKVKSKRGADRLYKILYNQYCREQSGGNMFGLDWRTLKMNNPKIYNSLKYLIHECDHLKD